MANGLIAAAMLSGAGQGIADAAKTGMQFVGASMLQRERQAMEDRRMQLMEQAAAAREQRGYDFQRGLSQERIGAELIMKGQERDFTKGEKEADRTFTREEKQADRTAASEERSADRDVTTAGQQITKQHGEDTIAITKRGQDLTAEHGRDQLATQKQYYAAVERHYAAMERAAQAKTDSARANANKDLSETAKELANLEKAQGQDYMKMAAAENLDEKNRNYLIKQADAHFSRAKMHLGYTGQDAGPAVQIKDRFAESLSGTQGTPPPPPPSINRGEEYLSNKKTETDQRKDATRRDAMAAMNAGTGLISSVDPAQRDAPSTPSFPPMERQRPTGMQQPGEVSPPPPPMPTPTQPTVVANVPRELPRATPPTQDFLAEKRAESAQREQAMTAPKPQSNPLIGNADASPGPSTADVSPKATPTSYLTLLESVPAEKREYVKSQIQEAVDNLRKGKINEDQFRSSILLAWTSVPGSPDEWQGQANALAQGLLAKMRGAK